MAFVTGASLRLRAPPASSWATGSSSLSLRSPPPCFRVRPSRPARMSASGLPSDSPTSTSTTGVSLSSFLSDASTLGTIRFVCVSRGAVLETIGRFDYGVSNFSTPRGEYLTLASPDKTFEAHVNISVAKSVTLTTEKAKVGGHDLHVIRLLDETRAPVLSCLLMWDPSQGPGNYLHGAVEEFARLKAKYGERFDLA